MVFESRYRLASSIDYTITLRALKPMEQRNWLLFPRLNGYAMLKPRRPENRVVLRFLVSEPNKSMNIASRPVLPLLLPEQTQVLFGDGGFDKFRLL